MSKRSTHPDLSALQTQLESISGELANANLSSHAKRKLTGQARSLLEQVGALLERVDPVKRPAAFFDPSDPNVMGAVTALALVAQPRLRLAELSDHYGSGVYAIYYRGTFDLYRAISGTETPIYVGQAAPETAGARTPFEQGTRLSRRLKDHQRSIRSATKTIDINDFEVRVLVVQSKWEAPAESYLISLFQPIWNKEVKLVFGIGKHGDSSEKRGNARSPWDVIHDSRAWATTAISRPREEIYRAVDKHFEKWPAFQDIDAVLEHFLMTLRQFS